MSKFTLTILCQRSGLHIIVESQNFCSIERVPKTITYEIGILVGSISSEENRFSYLSQLAFSVFVILITIYNVLEELRHSKNSLLDSLRRNSAWIYFVSHFVIKSQFTL